MIRPVVVTPNAYLYACLTSEEGATSGGTIARVTETKDRIEDEAEEREA